MMIKVLLSHLQIAGLCNGACVMPTLYMFNHEPTPRPLSQKLAIHSLLRS